MANLECQRNLMILGLLGFGVLYILRVNLSVAIVAMVGSSKKLEDNAHFEESCPVTEKESLQQKETKFLGSGNLSWNEHVQGRALASFFYGYALTNFLGGHLADKFGGKSVYGYGVFLTSLLAFTLPSSARYSEKLFSFVRLLQGMTEGVTFPAVNSLMSSWVQPSRRSLFVSRIAGGSLIGTVVTLSLGGWIAETSFGWPSIFYLSGTVGLVWCVIWTRMIANHPNLHPTISDEEKNLITKEIGDSKSQHEVQFIPWRSIFTSLPFLSTMVAHCGSNFGFYCLLTELPTYLSTVHHFDLQNNGLISSLPYLLMWVLSILYANNIDSLTSRKAISIRQARRVSTSLGLFVPMLLLLCVSYAGCNSKVAIMIICFAVGVSGFVQCGFLCGYQDLAPNYAGTLTGIANTFATFPGFLAPLITGIIIKGQPTIEQWNKVFVLSSVIYCVSGVVYLCFMSSEVQPWNNSIRERKVSGLIKNI